MIDFFQKNLLFSRYGFYAGFTDLLWATIVSDPRSVSDIWSISVLVKLASMGISDPSLIKNIRDLLDSNIERYVNTALIKVAMLESAVNPDNSIHRELILRRLRYINCENNPQLTDIRM
jgi:hypothetical protein